MKRIILCGVALLLLAVGATFSQGLDLTGTWQGTLNAGAAQLRTVIQISKGDDGGWKAVFYSIDQGGQPLPVTTTTLQGSTLKMSLPGIGGSYEGKVSGDGNSISGTWTQGNPIPLNLVRATPNTAWAIPPPPAPMKPMAADADPSFEVATIKPSNPDAQGKGIRFNRAREFTTLNTTLSDMITFAYGLHAKQIVGGPDWMSKDKYDILAKPADEGMPNDKQLKTMLQKLLADRFQLVFHHDKQELAVYAIEITKDGPKLAHSTGDPNGLPGLFFRGLGDLTVNNATMADFAGLMQSAVLDKPVVDQTGLTGRYDFTLKWTPDEFQFSGMGVKPPPPTDDPSAPPDLYTAVQQQLGLKFDSTKAPVDVLVIDKVTQPSAN
jgi:uncharacterized protein (TIGR03435 family)